MKTDSKLKEDVMAQLSWEPNLEENQIGVTVEGGVVTLSGVVNDYAQKTAAERAVKKVDGVKAVAEEIEVKYGDAFKKSDKEIAKAAVHALEWNIAVPEEKIMIEVKEGGVYLTGEVKWNFQRDAAKKSIEHLIGVKYVVNNITIKQEVKVADIEEQIKKAFERSADVEAEHITVEVDGNTVTLKGSVHTLAQKDEARSTAFNSPNVYVVRNELKVGTF